MGVGSFTIAYSHVGQGYITKSSTIASDPCREDALVECFDPEAAYAGYIPDSRKTVVTIATRTRLERILRLPIIALIFLSCLTHIPFSVLTVFAHASCGRQIMNTVGAVLLVSGFA